MSKRRAVITGMAVITPVGLDLYQSWENLKNGVSGIKKITHFPCSHLKCQIAGVIYDFEASEFLDKKTIKRWDRMAHLFLSAAKMAIEDAYFECKDPFRTSVIGATALGPCHVFEESCHQLFEGKKGGLSPFLIVNLAGNTVAGELASMINAKGPLYFLQEACAAGTKAIGLAKRLIEQNEVDVVVVAASDSGITPVIMAGLDRMGAVASKWNDRPEKASRPFDRDRAGFVPSEGAGAMVIEEYEHALEREAKVYAEVAGFGATCDAYHVTAPEPEAQSISQCMRMALTDAGIKPEEIDYINAHGTSTPANDRTETKGIKMVFGEHAYSIPISSNKSMIGHLWGAAGMVESVFSVMSINTGIIPPTINYENPDPECDLDYVPNVARKKVVNAVLKNSFGFGGINASLVFRKI